LKNKKKKQRIKLLNFRSLIEGIQFPALEHFSRNKLLAKDIVYHPNENTFTFYGMYFESI
jgi:hypothetical protein